MTVRRMIVLLPLAGLLFSGCASDRHATRPAHNFDKWEREISAYEQSDRTNPPPKGAILFVGSSTIRLWTNLPAEFPNHHIINRGFGGSEIVDSTHFASRIIFPYEPRMVLLRAGGNDLWAGKTAKEVFADFREFAKTVHERLPATEIVYISLSPSIARWSQSGKELALNRMVRRFIRGKRYLIYLETYSLPLGPDGQPRPELFRADKLHFSAEGYTLLAEKVRTVLAEGR